MKTILAPIDFSEVSGAVVSEAAALARESKGRVVLLTVIQPPVISSDYAPLMENLSEIMVCGERAAAANLAKVQSRLEKDSIPVETIQLTGAPVAQIVEQAAKLSADYIVMGSHGRKGLEKLVLGSVTQRVLSDSLIPVLVVRQ